MESEEEQKIQLINVFQKNKKKYMNKTKIISHLDGVKLIIECLKEKSIKFDEDDVAKTLQKFDTDQNGKHIFPEIRKSLVAILFVRKISDKMIKKNQKQRKIIFEKFDDNQKQINLKNEEKQNKKRQEKKQRRKLRMEEKKRSRQNTQEKKNERTKTNEKRRKRAQKRKRTQEKKIDEDKGN